MQGKKHKIERIKKKIFIYFINLRAGEKFETI